MSEKVKEIIVKIVIIFVYSLMVATFIIFILFCFWQLPEILFDIMGGLYGK